MANIKDILDGIRRYIDNEPNDPIPSRVEAAAAKKSESELFLQKLKVEIERILRSEITRIPDTQRAYVPGQFVVFLSEEDNKSLSDQKRRFFEEGLGTMLLETARGLSGNLELSTKKISVRINTDGNLENGEIDVRAIAEDIKGTVETIKPENSAAKGAIPNPHLSKDTVDDLGTIEDVDSKLGILYRVEIWKSGKKVSDYPIILRSNTVGRDDEEIVANLRLPTDNRKIARLHAEIALNNEGEIWVTALHKNPTIVSGRVIRNGEKAKLEQDFEIQIYEFVLRIKFSD